MPVRNRPDIAFAIVFLVLCLVYVLRAFFSSDVALLPPALGNTWITFPEVEFTGIYQEKDEIYRQAVFRKFVGKKAGSVEISISAMQSFKLSVNQLPVFDSAKLENWKRPSRVDLGPYLDEELNEILVLVENPKGPPLLSVSASDGAKELGTALSSPEEKWQVSRNAGKFVDAVVADDTRAMVTKRNFPSSLENLRSKGVIVALLFALGSMVYILMRRQEVFRSNARMPVIVLGMISLLWVLLFFLKHSHIPFSFGYDAKHHVYYVLYLLRENALPLPHEAWETFQPPLFYVLAAGLYRLGYIFGGDPGAVLAIKTLPMLSGLGVVWIAFFLCRIVFPGDFVRQTAAVIIAGLTPMGLYMSGYLSNESLHAMLLGLFILLSARVLSAPNSGMLALLGLGVAWGFAMLAKMTSAPFLFIALLFVGLKLRRVDCLSWSGVGGRLAAITAAGLAVCGWFYLRNISLYGSPFVGNFDLIYFWQQPGYHTVDYYLKFGSALIYPFFAGAQSFWDGVYATFWTDAFIGGRLDVASGHVYWNYSYMSIVSLLALPATILLVWGLLTTTKTTLLDIKGRLALMRLFLICALIAMGALIIHYTLTFPYWSTPKSFYGWGLLPVVAVLGADGFARMHHRVVIQSRGMLQGSLFYGWITALSGAILLSFLV